PRRMVSSCVIQMACIVPHLSDTSRHKRESRPRPHLYFSVAFAYSRLRLPRTVRQSFPIPRSDSALPCFISFSTPTAKPVRYTGMVLLVPFWMDIAARFARYADTKIPVTHLWCCRSRGCSVNGLRE